MDTPTNTLCSACLFNGGHRVAEMFASIDCTMWWKQRLKIPKFPDNEEVEMAVRKWLQMQDVTIAAMLLRTVLTNSDIECHDVALQL